MYNCFVAGLPGCICRLVVLILLEPQRTSYDLNFQLFGFPVRIHPLFWLMCLLTGFSLLRADPNGFAIFTWSLVVFVSILIHELGHALMFRRFGEQAHIVLYMMGGLAIAGDDAPQSSWSSYSSSSFRQRSHTPAERIIISFAGPAAGFILAAFVIVGVYATGGYVRPILTDNYLPWWDMKLGGAMQSNQNLWMLANFLLYVNIWWGLMNLLPIFPLDGGQIAQQLLVANDPWGGTIRALWLSIIVAAAVAVLGAIVIRDLFVVLLFASLAASNYFTLQQTGGGGSSRPW
jgi:stage IV sporulation protein FB